MNCIIIGGFLGSGKTTFINFLLKKAAENRPRLKTALLINEFGEIPVDGAMMDAGSYSMREITGGCICCSLKGMLSDAVAEIKTNEAPDLLIVEATGLAVPSEISASIGAAGSCGVHSLLCVDPMQYERLAGRLAIYDRQLKDADRLLFTKADIRSDGLLKNTMDAVDAEYPGRQSFYDYGGALRCIFDESSDEGPGPEHPDVRGHNHSHSHEKHELKDGIVQFTHRFTEVIDTGRLKEVVVQAAESAGPDLYRVKGIVRTDAGWISVQFADGELELRDAGRSEEQSFIVFIGEEAAIKEVENDFKGDSIQNA